MIVGEKDIVIPKSTIEAISRCSITFHELGDCIFKVMIEIHNPLFALVAALERIRKESMDAKPIKGSILLNYWKKIKKIKRQVIFIFKINLIRIILLLCRSPTIKVL